MKAIMSEYYGDEVRWFLGTVIDNSPPYGLEGRVKIRIHGIHSDDVNDIPQKDLPWAQVMLPGDQYGVSGLGTAPQLLAGALVFGIFLDGKVSQLPMILGSLPRVEYPTSVQAQGREDLASNPFSYDFQQTNADAVDPILNVTSSSAADTAKFFIDNGFRAKQASSIVGVLQEISNLDPTQEANGYGIAGWPKDSPRYKRFFAYCQRLLPAKDPSSYDVQLLYVLHELKSSKRIAYTKVLAANDIEGTLYGERIDGIDRYGNGMVAALVKYYVHPNTKCDKASAEGIALRIYGGLGAR
jgi:hypothetical protein